MMRFVAFVTFWLALLVGSVLFADKPEIIDEADLLRVQLAEAQASEAEARAAALKLVAQQAVASLRAKYHLGDADGIDPQTRAIRRAPKKTETKKEAR